MPTDDTEIIKRIVRGENIEPPTTGNSFGPKPKWIHNSKIAVEFNPIQDRGWVKKALPTNFPPVTFTHEGISHRNFLTFSFNPFVTLVSNFLAIPMASPKCLSLTQEHPSKKLFFLVKSL